MASQEHMQQLMSASSSSGDDDEDTSSDDGEPTVAKLPLPPPKLRLKVSLRMPMKKKPKISPQAKLDDEAELAAAAAAHVDDEVSATVVDSDEGGDDDAVVAVVEEPEPLSCKAGSTTSKSGGASLTNGASSKTTSAKSAAVTSKRRPPNPSRPIRLPPMSSPGLLIPPSSGLHRGGPAVDTTTGFVTPASVFDHNMSLAGYTTEGRTQKPHRGSSIKRVVGDMFDTNIAFSNNFPPLVPKHFSLNETSATNGASTHSEKLLRSLEKHVKESKEQSADISRDTPSRKRRRPWTFNDIVPVSLTIPYQEAYIEKRLNYVKKVEKRERAIVAAQKAEEDAEIAKEQHGEDAKIPDPVTMPPIPEPPSPPRIGDMMKDSSFATEDLQDNHPLYPPKNGSNFVAHLDKACFHITDGRYFGLYTNSIADPHFCGPNAPGIMGLTVSCGSGLATSTASSGGAGGGGGSASALSALQQANSTSASAGSAANATKKSKGGGSAKKLPSSKSSSANGSKSNSSSGKSKSSSKKSKKKQSGPVPTASAVDLRKIMEEGGSMAERMRNCIIRAAVYASRSGQHGQSFLGSDGQSYPDVSKAFAAHAGLKPCIRCKNNKQGAYHCRLRRKHKDLDHDGQNSHAVLAPLFQEPIEDLLSKPS